MENGELWVEALTWTEMDPSGVLRWLDRGERNSRREKLAKLERSALK
jgi:hypothetical protein